MKELNTQHIILNIDDMPIVYVAILLLITDIFIEKIERAVQSVQTLISMRLIPLDVMGPSCCRKRFINVEELLLKSVGANHVHQIIVA